MVPRRRKTCKTPEDRSTDLQIEKKISFRLNDFQLDLLYPDGKKRTLGGITDERNPHGVWIRWFHKTIKENHFLRTPRAIGISVAAVKFLKQARVDWLYVKHATLGIEYRCTLRTFLENSFEQRRSDDHDVQLFLTLDHWQIRHPVLEAAPMPRCLQLDLFSEEVPA